RTRVLLDRYGVSARLISFHEHNERQRTPQLVKQMRDGAVVALVSDAGMPLVSDPGFLLVRGCVAAGLAVEVLPGPTAAVAAVLAERYGTQAPRGEVVLVIGGAPAPDPEAQAGPAVDAVRRLVEAGAKPRPAAAVVSELTGVAANTLYQALTGRP